MCARGVHGICNLFALRCVEDRDSSLGSYPIPSPVTICSPPRLLVLIPVSASLYPNKKVQSFFSNVTHSARPALSLSLALAVTDVARGTVAVAAVATVRDPYS